MTSPSQNRFKFGAQLIALCCFIASFICCLGGVWAIIVGSLDSVPDVPEISAYQTILGFLTFFLCSAFLVALGTEIWFLFGRNRLAEPIVPRVIAMALLTLSPTICLWAGLGAASGPVLVDQLPEAMAEQLLLGFSLDSGWILLLGALPWVLFSTIIGLAGIATWFWFVRPAAGIGKSSQGQSISLAVLQNKLTGVSLEALKANETLWRQTKTEIQMALSEASNEEKRAILELLYCSNLVVGKAAITLAGVDLSGINLSNADFTGVDFRGVNFNNCDFTYAELASANFAGANLNSADLRSTNLESANLKDANLCGAKLHRANLRKANLSGTNLAGANLWETDLRDTSITWQQLENTISTKRAKLPDFDRHDATQNR